MGHLQYHKNGVKIAFIKVLEQTLNLSFSTKEITVRLFSRSGTYYCLAQKACGFPRVVASISTCENCSTAKFIQVEPQRGRFEDPLADVLIENV